MQRIIEDMEKALCCIPLDIHASQLPHSAQASAVLNSQFHNNHSRSKISLGNAYDVDNSASKATLKTASQEQLRDITTSSNLVKRLMSTVSRITKIPGMAEVCLKFLVSYHVYYQFQFCFLGCYFLKFYDVCTRIPKDHLSSVIS